MSKDFKNFAKTFEKEVEQTAKNIIKKGQATHVRLMPDTHIGKGVPIGFTGKMTNKLSPSIVGVDIGCGVLSKTYNLEIENKEEFLKNLDKVINKKIPAGFDPEKGTDGHKRGLMNFKEFKETFIDPLSDFVKEKLTKEDIVHFQKQLGSLGSGNHFIEGGFPETKIKKVAHPKKMIITIHSGSRGFGAFIASKHQQRANEETLLSKIKPTQEKIEALKEGIKKEPDNHQKGHMAHKIKSLREQLRSIQKSLKSASEALKGDNLKDYLNDMEIAVDYAKWNRELIFNRIEDGLFKFYKTYFINTIESTHNFIDGTGIIRKGATPARRNQKLLIPLNMRDGIIIGKGKGKRDWNYSAPHGAGRLLSRKKAFKTLSLNSYLNLNNIIYSSTIKKETLDESPGAYKDSEESKNLIEKNVKILTIIKPIYSFKGYDKHREEKKD